MFYIEDEHGTRILTVGYNGGYDSFEYRGVELRTIVRLPDWEPVARAVLQRLEFDDPGIAAAIDHIRDGLAAEAEVTRFLEKLARERSSDYYFYQRSLFPIEDLRAAIRQRADLEATRHAKREHSSRRRREFDGQRDALVLRMLDAGHLYVCAQAGCEVHVDLTVDHIVALSRGGADDLDNLQFLCGPHNSAKGDREA